MKRLTRRFYSTVQKQKKVLVLGLTLEGLATSLSFKMKNIHCDIVEQERDLSKYEGRSIILPQNATKILNELRLLSTVKKYGHEINEYKIKTHTGNSLLDMNLNSFEFPFIGISEKMLIQILMDKFKQLPNGKLIMNDTVKYSENKDGKWDCSFRKSFIKQEYDCLVGAEGVESKIRKEFFKSTSTPRKIEKVSTILKVPSYMDYQDKTIEWFGGVGKVQVYPISDEYISVESTWFFPFISGRKKTSSLISQFDRMHKNWSGYGIENLLSEISQAKMSRDTLIKFDFEAYYDNIIDEFVTKNIALVGESAHSIDPSGFQKPTVAFEDGFILAKYKIK
eukprot:gene1873-1014_t